MSVVSVRARSFILALFIRDDGERFLLGDNGFDFKDSQLHFSANTIENDEVAKQGVDGVMLAGQVRRASVQSFDGYVGDATTLKEEVEQMRRDFIAFFAKGHHFRVIYIDCNRNAWQRKGGYLVDAPEVKEMWQIHPEYHVGLNFEDVNYYEYDENAEGEEILSNIISVPISSDVEGGLVWDEDGAVSEDATVVYDGDTATASGKSISIADAVEAPLSDFELKGETSQQTYTGKNLCGIPDQTFTHQGVTVTIKDGEVTMNGTATGTGTRNISLIKSTVLNGDYTTNLIYVSGASNSSTNINLRRASDHSLVGGTQTDVRASNNYRAYSVSNESVELGLYINPNGAVFSNLKFKIQIVAGSTADYDFEPYTAGASPNPDYPQAVQTVTGENVVKISDGQGNEQSYEVNLGKNLFDKNNASGLFQGYISGGKAWTASDYWCYYIPCQPNTTYTASRTIIGNGGRFAIATSQAVPGNGVDVAQLTQDNTATSLTITTNSSAKYIIVWFANVNDAGSESLADWEAVQQLEKGSQATTYAPYFTPIELCKIGTYQDYIYKSGDKWYVRKEVGHTLYTGNVLGIAANQGSGETIASATGAFFVWVAYLGLMSENLGTLNSGTISGNADANAMTDGTFATRSGTPDRLYFRNTAYIGKTGNEMKAILASNSGGASIWHALATPTDTEITNEALVAQLEAILSQGYTYAGTNNITTVIAAGNEQGELEITYYTKYDAKVVGGGYVWEAGGSGGPTIVTNESISAVSPVWTVFGTALNPMLENTTTGEQIQYVGMIGEGQTLVVDMGEQTARLDGLNVISNIVGEYLTLAPGSNTLLFSAEGDAPASEIGWSEIVG